MGNSVLCKISAELLRLAADRFSCNSCSDYEIPNTPENREFLKASNEDLYISDDGKLIHLADWATMIYCAKQLEKMGEAKCL